MAMTERSSDEPRLTSLAHGGGCGCKLSPAVLRELLAGAGEAGPFAGLLVGTETGDDAAVFRLNDAQALVATTDFFTPIVDDPFEFGRIAATNALSDVYAMGGRPILALAVLGMPLGRLGTATVGRILAGGAAVCASVGIAVAGGHSIDSPEPIYGLVALGLVHPDRVRRNSGARAGDALLLTKGLGIGVYGAALKRGMLAPEALAGMIRSTTTPNTAGTWLAERDAVTAVTDVTGFGLLGHALEMCRGAGIGLALEADAVPLLPGVERLAREGCVTGASGRNWDSYGHEVELPDVEDDGLRRALLCDPQTSGGLLVAVRAEAADGLVEELRRDGFAETAAIGRFEAGAPMVRVV